MHHIIPLHPLLFGPNPESIFDLIHITPIDVYPNGLLINKNTPIAKPYWVNVDLNTILFICPCIHIRNNNLLLRISGQGNHCIMICSTLLEVLEWLPASFIRIHDSFIINKYKATFISPNIEMHISNFIVPIGRYYSDEVFSVFLPHITHHNNKTHHKKQNN